MRFPLTGDDNHIFFVDHPKKLGVLQSPPRQQSSQFETFFTHSSGDLLLTDMLLTL